jgi:integrase
MLGVLLGCGLRRSELVHLKVEDIQQCEDHWAILDLVGKGGHVRMISRSGLGEETNGRPDKRHRERIPVVYFGRSTRAESSGETA